MADDFISGMLSGQQYQLNQQSIAMNKLMLQEEPVKIEKEKLALKIGQQDYDKRQKMADFLAAHSAKVPEGENPLTNAAEALTEAAGAAFKYGLYEEGIGYVEKASTISTQQATAAYKNWRQAAEKTKLASQYLSTIPTGVSQEEGQRRLDAINSYLKMSGTPSALEGQRYSPELIEQLKQGAIKHESDAKLALEKAQTNKDNIEARAAAELIPLRKSQTDLNITRKNNAEKFGPGGLIAQPKFLSAAAAEIRKKLGNEAITANDAKADANDIALRAEELVDKNHMTLEQATTKAVDEAHRQGKWAGITPDRKAPGQDWRKPLPWTPTTKGKPNEIYAPQTAVTNSAGEVWPAGEPRWYDEGTNTYYPKGEGPDEEGDDE